MRLSFWLVDGPAEHSWSPWAPSAVGALEISDILQKGSPCLLDGVQLFWREVVQGYSQGPSWSQVAPYGKLEAPEVDSESIICRTS